MKSDELKFYDKVKDWDFSKIKYVSESLTDWNMYEILNKNADSSSKILDLGTGGGEKLIKNFPKAKEILGTDFSSEMIKSAERNLRRSSRDDISFKLMDNLKMTTPDNYFDMVVARHTRIDAKQVYRTLRSGGLLVVQGVDKLDCWELKRMFKNGQAYNDPIPMSVRDYEDILSAGFKNVELVPIHVREYYETKEDLLALLLKTPILLDFSKEEKDKYLGSTLDMKLLDDYISSHRTDKGILLIRREYGITAAK